MKEAKKNKIKENVTNIVNLGAMPIDEVQLSLDVAYNSILDEVCTVVPVETPDSVVSYLALRYGSKEKDVEQQGAVTDKKYSDIKDRHLMNGVSMPLDDYGFPTNTVRFYASDNTSFTGNYKNIIPGTVAISNKFIDDGKGNIITPENVNSGTVDYNSATFKITNNTFDSTSDIITYKFDLRNIPTSRNMVYWQKASKFVAAEQFQFDVDSAVTLDHMHDLKLKLNSNVILPEVLSQQRDSYILQKYFDFVHDFNDVNNKYTVYNLADATSYGTLKSDYIAANDISVKITKQMSKYAHDVGIYPNVILCDEDAIEYITSSHQFMPIHPKDEENTCAGFPRKIGYFNSASVIVVKSPTRLYNKEEVEKPTLGTIILTYRGNSDAQTSGVLTEYIPVTLRDVIGSEGQGMLNTYNLYSMFGFTFTNPYLIQGIVIVEK